ncbi:hypothetical protein OH492_28420 [Vibrio chagasii]|nr:hypothetical protein [Vibrio chagasii]
MDYTTAAKYYLALGRSVTCSNLVLVRIPLLRVLLNQRMPLLGQVIIDMFPTNPIQEEPRAKHYK